MPARCLFALTVLLLADLAVATEVRIADRDSPGLIAAIEAANAAATPTTIHLAEHGLYTLASAADPDHQIGLPILRGSIRIDGHDAEIRRYANADYTLIAIATGAEVQLNDLTLAEGSEGALVNRGKVQLNRVKVVDNVARTVSAIVENYGSIRIRDSEISYNQLAGSQRDAGTVVNYGTLQLERTRIVGNVVSRRYDSLYAASAVLNFGKLHLHDVAIEENAAEAILSAAALGSIINLGTGNLEASALTLVNNEPPESNRIDTSDLRFHR
ncbi:MAG: hypothetical protein COS34_13760 [Lysobacterales bacterium CG02_land_8_20_14_3_00_62_12]|nr:MAG: hypothetical protein COS34_13760 [Xanthomonadales bacterium CG02_land_8_20_14_3_00_62_12]